MNPYSLARLCAHRRRWTCRRCAWPPTTSTRACAASGPRKRLEIHNLGLGDRGAGRRPGVPAGGAAVPPPRGAPLRAHLVRLARRRAGRVPGARRLRGGLPHQRRHAPRRARQRAAVALAAGRHRPPRRQRPPLRAARPAARAGALERQHACMRWWRTSGWCTRSRVRQVQRLADFIAARGAARTSRWSWPATSTTGARSSTRRCASSACSAPRAARPARAAPDLSVAGAGVRARPHLHCAAWPAAPRMVPRGTAWARMSDHLPLVAELEPA